MRGGDEGNGETQREKLCFPLQANHFHKWNACYEPAHGQKEQVQNSWISNPGDLCSLDLTWIILHTAHTIKHNLFPLLRAVVNIYHWHVRVFQGPFSKLAADLTRPELLRAERSQRSHKAGLGIGSAAPQSAVNTPCILCSAAVPVLLNISQSPQPLTQHPTHCLENIYYNNSAGALLSCNKPQGEMSHCLNWTSKVQWQRKTTSG